MHILLSALLTAFGTAAVQAVDIVLYPGNSSCLAGFASIGCFNVRPLSCCRPSVGDWAFFNSARCDGLSAADTCAIARVSGDGAGRPCGAMCGAATGPGAMCARADGCWASGLSGFGAYWFERPAGLAREEVRTECEGAVEPDRATFTNGRAFRIGHDVPLKINALLGGLVRSDPQLSQGVPSEAAPFEIEAETLGIPRPHPIDRVTV